MSDFMRTLCKIAIPVTLQGMLQASFSIVDQIMIGQLGEAGIAAVGLCSNFTLIFSVMSGRHGCRYSDRTVSGCGGAHRGVAQFGCKPCLRGCVGSTVSADGRGLPGAGLGTLYGSMWGRGTSASWRSLICPWRSAPSCPHGCVARNTPLSPFGQVLAR